ncbi:MAG: hypothetical protein CMP23_08135 [Rickettsiales bacterium]|nr:hypothetical protein [Rickettsiales bacterium]
MSAPLSSISSAGLDGAVLLDRLRASVRAVFRGRTELVDRLLIAALAGGHVLIEDVPGVGKSTLAQALARALGCSFTRLQFTSDLLPADVLGVNVYDAEQGGFRFHPGPIFCNVLLADEINRSTPKTQSSLLEAMNEGQVTIDGELRELPQPFLVLATQNPFEFHGTFPLPESQLDRFLMRLEVGYPDPEQERLLLQQAGDAQPQAEQILDAAALRELQQQAMAVSLHHEVESLVVELLGATRATPGLALGASPRAGRGLVAAARARAFMAGRDFVVPDDIVDLAEPVLAHRMIAAPSAEPGGARDAAAVLTGILGRLEVPR